MTDTNLWELLVQGNYPEFFSLLVTILNPRVMFSGFTIHSFIAKHYFILYPILFPFIVLMIITFSMVISYNISRCFNFCFSSEKKFNQNKNSKESKLNHSESGENVKSSKTKGKAPIKNLGSSEINKLSSF